MTNKPLLAGVCSDIADKHNANAWTIRILLCVLCALTLGIGIVPIGLVYLALIAVRAIR